MQYKVKWKVQYSVQFTVQCKVQCTEHVDWIKSGSDGVDIVKMLSIATLVFQSEILVHGNPRTNKYLQIYKLEHNTRSSDNAMVKQWFEPATLVKGCQCFDH